MIPSFLVSDRIAQSDAITLLYPFELTLTDAIS
jgi:hypothetical protein